MAVVQHGHHCVHAPEHLGQNLVLVGQRQAGRDRLGEGVIPLVRRQLTAAGNTDVQTLSLVSVSDRDRAMTPTCSFTNLSWIPVSLCALSSASFSSALLWAFAASSLARASVALSVLASPTGALEGLRARDLASSAAEAVGEAGEGAVGTVTEASLGSLKRSFILWRRDLRAAMSSLHRL